MFPSVLRLFTTVRLFASMPPVFLPPVCLAASLAPASLPPAFLVGRLASKLCPRKENTLSQSNLSTSVVHCSKQKREAFEPSSAACNTNPLAALTEPSESERVVNTQREVIHVDRVCARKRQRPHNSSVEQINGERSGRSLESLCHSFVGRFTAWWVRSHTLAFVPTFIRLIALRDCRLQLPVDERGRPNGRRGRVGWDGMGWDGMGKDRMVWDRQGKST